MEALLHTFKLAAGNACGTKTGIFPSIYDGLSCQNNEIHIESLSDILIIVGNLIQICLALAGALAVIFIIVGGVYYVTAAGDPSRLKRAKDIIIQAVTGLIIALVAFAVVNSIGGTFQ